MKNQPVHNIESVEYQKGAVVGRLLPATDAFEQGGASGKVVIFNKYQKFRKLKQGMTIVEAQIKIITHKKQFCVANIIGGKFINNKEQIKSIE